MQTYGPARRSDSEISLNTIDTHDRRLPPGSESNAASSSAPSLVTHISSSEEFREDEFPFVSKPMYQKRSQAPKRGWKALTGWKLGTTIAAALTLAILLGNLTLLAVFVTQIRKDGWTSNVAPVRMGDCANIKSLGTGIHLLINVISTLLLGASNYCMQTVSAPTREDVDGAHRAGSWLDIGVPSVRNLRYIRPRRLLVWLFLGLTSIPLHLVYNSIFFVSANNYRYDIWFADESFITGAAFGITSFSDSSVPATLQEQIMTTDKFEKLTNDECIRAYAKPLIEERRDLVLIVDRPEEDSCIFVHSHSEVYPHFPHDCGDRSPSTSLYGSMMYYTSFKPGPYEVVTNWFHWICGQDAKYPKESTTTSDGPPANLCSDGGWKTQLGADPWLVNGNKVKYCLSEKTDSQCTLQVAVNLLGVVVAFNAVKFVVILLMATSSMINDNPLVTLGDAAASYIKHPEPMTEKLCLLTKRDAKKSKVLGQSTAKKYRAMKLRWHAAASKTRWIIATILTATALAIILGLVAFASSNQNGRLGHGDLKTLWGYGLGTVSPYAIIEHWEIPMTGDRAVVGAVLVTNLPQLLLSFLYLIFNGLVTSMTTAAEWSRFAHKRHRALRVSFPKEGQRSTFFLQLPYRFSIPLMVFSVLIHWLVSQSFFVVQIIEKHTGYTRENDGMLEPSEDVILTTAGYSPMGMILTCCVILLMFLGACCLGIWRFREGMPLVGSCSLALSASCHAPPDTSPQLPLKWGVVSHRTYSNCQGVGHCSFSNGPVGSPVPGRLYA